MPFTSVTGLCLAPAKEFEVADSVGHLWIAMASVANWFLLHCWRAPLQKDKGPVPAASRGQDYRRERAGYSYSREGLAL